MTMQYKHKKILVVDDEPDILEFLQIVLQEEGYVVIITDKGDDVEKLPIMNNLPDLILLDVLLSGKDGREIVRYLKRQEETKHIPIIMFSAHPNAEQTVEEAGAEDFVAKPFDIDFLLKKIEQYL